MKKTIVTIILFVAGIVAHAQVPSNDQIVWQQMETYAFIHFGLNTFTDQEWGFGNVSPEVFNPTRLDCEQWVRTFVAAGMKGVIITAKHHDGFCLWPTKFTDYSIASSPYKDGKGDILRELSEACRKYGIMFGVYLSPWDRHQSNYGTKDYLEYYRNQLVELLTQYGDIFEIWFDGANGGDGWYGGANEERRIDRRSYYNFPALFKQVKELQPHAIIFSDGGPGCRWVGNEKGFANETNWSLLRGDEVYPGYPNYQELPSGHEDGYQWTAAECDVSIRPGWFYHEKEDDKVKTPEQLEEIYYKSVGRNATMLLNFPVNTEGLISKTDSANAVIFHQRIKRTFSQNLMIGASMRIRTNNINKGSEKLEHTKCYEYKLKRLSKISCLVLQENIAKGQKVKSFTISYQNNGKWIPIPCQEQTTTIGYKRILRFPPVFTKRLRLSILNSKGDADISFVGAY